MALLNEVSEPLSSRYWKRLMCQSLVERVNCKTGYKMVFLHLLAVKVRLMFAKTKKKLKRGRGGPYNNNTLQYNNNIS